MEQFSTPNKLDLKDDHQTAQATTRHKEPGSTAYLPRRVTKGVFFQMNEYTRRTGGYTDDADQTHVVYACNWVSIAIYLASTKNKTVPSSGTSLNDPRLPGTLSIANFISPTSISSMTDIDRSVMIPESGGVPGSDLKHQLILT